VCAQSDSLSQILDDIQDEDTGLNNWLEVLSEQILDQEQLTKGKYPKISLTHRFQYTVEENKAIADNIFLGSPFESYTRLRTSLYKNLSAGVLVQKDVGEVSYTDHYSGFISWNHPNHALKIILGNFIIRAAEGMLLSGPFSLPKISLINKQSLSRYFQARPFLSSNEYDGFLGGAVEIGDMKNIKLIAFYSHILRDGILSDNKTFVTGFERTGYHRTFKERTQANCIGETSYGGALRFPFYFIDQIGLTFVKTEYFPEIKAISSSEERRRNYFKYHGTYIENYSLFFAKDFHDGRISGELIPLKSEKIAYILSYNFAPSEWQFALKSWYIPAQFQSSSGRIPAESNPFPQSVNGFMLGMIGNPLADLKISTFWFRQNDLWRSYFQPLPVQKKEFYIYGEYRLGQKKYLYLRYHLAATDFYSSDHIGKLEKLKQSLRVQIKQSFGSKVRFQTRFEKVFLNYFASYPSKTGINFYQDFYWQLFKLVTFQIRFSSFYTDDFDSRLYEYENDLPHVFSNYPLYGQGRKWYVMITAKATPKVKMWLKYRRITYDGIESIGSGPMTIGGDMRQDVHIQVELRY